MDRSVVRLLREIDVDGAEGRTMVQSNKVRNEMLLNFPFFIFCMLHCAR
jgi:hypothetical protein